VGFLAPDPSRAGYRDLRVDVPSHPEVTSRARKGVVVGAGGGTESAFAGSPDALSPPP
jgi:hypothetical protein